jgi:hypothetical protein
MNSPAPALPLVAPVPRPGFIPKPFVSDASWQATGEAWVQGVESDSARMLLPSEKLFAEVSTFEIRKTHQARYTLSRIRAPFLEVGDQDCSSDWVDLLAPAVWANGFRVLTSEPAPTIVRGFFGSYTPQVPAYRLIICPHWMRRLGWRTHQENWLVYLDRSGAVVARIVWWRDGGRRGCR